MKHFKCLFCSGGKVHLLRHCTVDEVLVVQYFHLMLLYAFTPQQFSGKYCITHRDPFLRQLLLVTF